MRILKIVKEYSQSLSKLGIGKRAQIYGLLRLWLGDLIKLEVVNSDIEKMCLILQIFLHLNDDEMIGQIEQKLKQLFTQIDISKLTGFDQIICKWNASLFLNNLKENIGFDFTFAGECFLMNKDDISDDDFYKLAKFNLIVNQSDVMNWFMMIRFLMEKNQFKLSAFL